ncbi:MAG: Cytochrome c oxidase caa3-type assembly factor CtaG_BS (unrelated to Cox11-CtaG family) [uncultured Nocardioidaceae bacterium]|uniref:Cytochrome c oxidase caa3-type assembly factor CtaG_BS (Unrelated to Cox11-CtaG family) n=1 Tax=uncultured Nocardioidaceae bacterium TaxID=253824 RepID=A0A6J4LES9_9ACTN|nr:MAG: Cytochrome c oxidase caa3-type assembly factor CtaG_BS (unrelated to Cox11-CtaG family) [uncultured Nocardioidaceae bacterium]
MHVLAAGSDAVSNLPPFSLTTVLTEWSIAPVPLVVTVWAAGLYLAGVWRLRSRGDRWPVGRTVSFVGLGMGSFYLVTSSGLAAYDTVLLSVHMVQHMVLSMLTPLFLALGAPVTLALRTLPRRPRDVLLRLLHSRAASVLSYPPLTFALFVVSPWALYFSGWYEASLRSVFLHETLHLHLVLVGSLFFWPLLGTDPVPGRVGYPFRLILVFLTLPFHAFLGVTIMASETLIAGGWYRSLGLPWLPEPAVDQNLAGSILWGAGDLVGSVFFAVLFVQWVRQSTREAAREDRRLDRLESKAPQEQLHGEVALPPTKRSAGGR